MTHFTEYLEEIYRKSQFGLILPDGHWLILIAHLTAEATRFEQALVPVPLKSDDLGGTDKGDENGPDGIQLSIATQAEATGAPKKKQKSASKTVIEGR